MNDVIAHGRRDGTIQNRNRFNDVLNDNGHIELMKNRVRCDRNRSSDFSDENLSPRKGKKIHSLRNVNLIVTQNTGMKSTGIAIGSQEDI